MVCAGEALDAGIPVLGSPWFQISVMSFILGFISILLGLIADAADAYLL